MREKKSIPLGPTGFAELLLNYRLRMRVCGCNCEAPKANKTHENRSVRIGQVDFSKPPHSAALPPLRGLSSTAYHTTCDNLVAKWWPDGRESRPSTLSDTPGTDIPETPSPLTRTQSSSNKSANAGRSRMATTGCSILVRPRATQKRHSISSKNTGSHSFALPVALIR